MNLILKMLNGVLRLMNQLPEKQKLRTSPTNRSSPPKKKNQMIKAKVKPLKRQGPRHTEESIYNHPRR